MRVGTIVSLGASAALGLGALFVAKVALPAHSNVASAAIPAPVINGVPMVVAYKVSRAEEIMLLSSVRGVAPVVSLNGRELGVGPVAADLRERFEASL